MTDSEFLISLAQNDYMIDQNYLADGSRLLKIARTLDELSSYKEFAATEQKHRNAELHRLREAVQNFLEDLGVA